MKGNLRKVAALLLMALMALFAAAPTPAALASNGNPNPGVIPPQAKPLGHTYRDWNATFWRWLISIPTPINPELDQTGEHCAQGQSGPMWFLPSTGGGSAERNCTVPNGKMLLVVAATVECSMAEPVPFHGNNEAELRACAEGINDLVTRSEITVDGHPIRNTLTDYRFDTPLNTLAYPQDNLLGVPGPGSTLSVGDSFFVILAPLSVGRHEIHTYAEMPSVSLTFETTWHLTVGR